LVDFIVEADGGSRGNPGPAGSGAVVLDPATDRPIAEIARFVGIATNNVAEYIGLISALEWISVAKPGASVHVRMDSKLVIEQMSGNWKVKHPDMQQLAARANVLVAGLRATFEWIPRERNARADALANKAMDESADSVNEPGQAQPTTTGEAISSVVEFNHELPSSVRAPGGVTAPLTTVILVRHGRTALTESKKISGSGGENPFLSDAGVHDAEKVAAELAKIGISGPWAHLPKPSVLIASPINRTVHTAQIIGERLGLEVATNGDIAEISFGVWDGHTNDEVKAKWPQEFAEWQGSWSYSPPGGESLEAFDLRVQRGRREILAANVGSTVVVVSHVMPTRGFLRAANEGGISAYWRPQISPCSISIVRFWGDQAAEIVTMNSTSHLV
jgi:ribonuclease H / adenosylcobalamin/alpha-ribazole phosphatase